MICFLSYLSAVYAYIEGRCGQEAGAGDGDEDGADGGGAVVGGAARRGRRAQAREGGARDPRQGGQVAKLSYVAS